jgi:hypothetical protein
MAMSGSKAGAGQVLGKGFVLGEALPVPPINGAACFAVHDTTEPSRALIALAIENTAPARPGFFTQAELGLIGAALPLGLFPGLDPRHGTAKAFAVLPALPPLRLTGSLGKPVPESVLYASLLAPIAQSLSGFAAVGLTHRAIRPDNLFTAEFGQPVMLGPCFNAPPALHQPALFEPPYSAWCLASARGDGAIADDVYALGVTLLTLWHGAPLLPGVSDEEILRRKIAAGCFAALTDGLPPLPPGFAELLQAMLAVDPEHRPPPAQLMSAEGTRQRRLTERQGRRATQALAIGGIAAGSARELAYALARAPEAGLAALRAGQVDQWLRRGLGDAQMAMTLEATVHARGQDIAEGSETAAHKLLGAIMVLDPLAPLVWHHTAFMPDGIGPALAGLGAEAAQAAIANEEFLPLLAGGGRPRPMPGLAGQVQLCRAALQTHGIGGGLPRLRFSLNPLLPCLSPLLGNSAVLRLSDLLPALERAASGAPPAGIPADTAIAGYIAAHGDSSVQSDCAMLGEIKSEIEFLCLLKIFAKLQNRFQHPPLPHVAASMLRAGSAMTPPRRSKTAAANFAERGEVLARAGLFMPLRDHFDDRAAREADRSGALAAEQHVTQLETMHRYILQGTARRNAAARVLGREIAAGIGIAGSAIAVVRLVLG